jgi:hypothetical protein
MMREFQDREGNRWEAFAGDAIVAHGKPGAVLSFRSPGSPEGEYLRSGVTFNSMAAADFALRTMSDMELNRRLSLARMALGGV